jgi:hypothetical protein
VFIPVVIEITITPIAKALVEINAIAASPLILLFSEIRNRKNAAKTTTGIETVNGATFIAVATAKVPKPTCESPSPIIEYRFKTRLTPNNAEQSATSKPTTTARTRNVYENISFNISNTF